MNNNYTAGPVGVSIFIGRLPVRGPSRVAYGKIARFRESARNCLKRADLSFASPYAYFTVLKKGDSRGIVSPVFEALQAVHHDGNGIPAADIADYPAHIANLICFSFYLFF